MLVYTVEDVKSILKKGCKDYLVNVVQFEIGLILRWNFGNFYF